MGGIEDANQMLATTRATPITHHGGLTVSYFARRGPVSHARRKSYTIEGPAPHTTKVKVWSATRVAPKVVHSDGKPSSNTDESSRRLRQTECQTIPRRPGQYPRANATTTRAIMHNTEEQVKLEGIFRTLNRLSALTPYKRDAHTEMGQAEMHWMVQARQPPVPHGLTMPRSCKANNLDRRRGTSVHELALMPVTLTTTTGRTARASAASNSPL